MNYDRIKENVGMWVRLRPRAIRKRTGEDIDDNWRIESISRNGISIYNLRTQHLTTLGLDQVHSYMGDPSYSPPDGMRHGFLTLNVQLTISDLRVETEPLPPGPRAPSS